MALSSKRQAGSIKSLIVNADNNIFLLIIGILSLIIVTNIGLINEIRTGKVLKMQNVYSYEERFKELRKYLVSVKKVGYVTDCQKDDNDSKARLYITQYAIAPVIVDETSGNKYVVGNFCHNNISMNILSANNLIPVKDFGRGVMLFRKASRQ